MAGGYSVPTDGPLGELIDTLREHSRRIKELEAPTGTQTAQALQQLTDLVAGLLDQTNVTATNDVTAGNNVTAGGEGIFDTGLRSTGAALLDITTIAGSRQSAWQHISTGRYGYAPSTLAEKRNLRPVPFTAADILTVAPRVFHYRGQLDIRDNPKNPAHDPAYLVPDEIGLLAEELIAAGLDLFVMFEEDGTPRGIHYELFGAVTALVIGADLNTRMTALENRIDSIVAGLNGA